MQSPALFNPFPGLRPFKPDEDHLFFGREKQIDELLRRLRSTRFLSVIGTSGSGKSSLVRSGLIPALQGGFMAKAGSSWRVSVVRPGEDPIRNLAASLSASNVLGTAADLASASQLLLEVTLRRSTLGLIEAVRQAMISPGEKLLLVVDQFEELFRFRRSRQIENSRDEAVAFVKLLLEATEREDGPIYVVLTMRSDFIGDCVDYPGLPEAVNAGLYLVPRMTRDELRSAIAGPVAVAGGEVTQRLVQRLLNDVGDEQDQLPVLQHALMRTWDHWQAHRTAGHLMDISEYEEVGTMREALSRHADEAFEETGSDRSRYITERLFKALTDTFSDARGVRRPTSIAKLVDICGADEAEVFRIVEVFRRPGRSFLMPSSDDVPELNSRSIIDISHESLMRRWVRLTTWAEQESRAAGFYVRRLSPTAVGFFEGTAALWGNPDLAYALRWRQENQPTAAWAEQYNTLFAEVMQFLDRSECVEAERQAKERMRLQRAKRWAVAFAILSGFAVGGASLAGWEYSRAKKSLSATREADSLAEKNLNYAEETVAEMLRTVNGPTESSETPAVPGLEDIRKQSLERARTFYGDLGKQYVQKESVANGVAVGYLESGQMDLRLRHYVEAAEECQQAITAFGELADQHASKPVYREQLANSADQLGETLRISGSDPTRAEQAYGQAIATLQGLRQSYPQTPSYTQELARTYYNRGIFLKALKQFDASRADIDMAVKLLEPLAADPKKSEAAWELARAYNNRANLLFLENQDSQAELDFEHATRIGEALVKQGHDSPDHRLELAQYHDGLAGLLEYAGNIQDARKAADRAQQLIHGLSTPTVSVSLEQANVYMIRGAIIEPDDPREAAKQYQNSMDVLEGLKNAGDQQLDSNFNLQVFELASSYLELAESSWKAGALAEARSAVEHVRLLLPDVREPDRDEIRQEFEKLREKIYKLPSVHN
jgi:tetratricopeptide (TPR) repeat protein/energy-coupling factor transporter ATP-binding protein EcfA2